MTDRHPQQKQITNTARDRKPGSHRAYHSPRLQCFGPLTEVTLGLSQPGQESGGGGTRCNTVGIDC